MRKRGNVSIVWNYSCSSCSIFFVLLWVIRIHVVLAWRYSGRAEVKRKREREREREREIKLKDNRKLEKER